jgi:hypothetical protein
VIERIPDHRYHFPFIQENPAYAAIGTCSAIRGKRGPIRSKPGCHSCTQVPMPAVVGVQDENGVTEGECRRKI